MKKILLIEDDPLDAALTKRGLRSVSVENEVVHLKDGQAFLNYLRQETDPNVCLAIMDLKMPRLDGIEVLERLQATQMKPYFPIVVFSSSSQPEDIQRCYQLGCNAYVAKPMNHRDFAAVIKQIGQFWIFTNEMPFA